MIKLMLAVLIAALMQTTVAATLAQEVLFEDKFDGPLSKQWKPVGLRPADYRIRDGALELRVQTGPRQKTMPMMQVILPFDTSQSVAATVDVLPLDPFTQEGESAGLHLTDADSSEFSVQKKNINRHLVFSPGTVEFIGEEGQEGDSQQYALKFWPARQDAGPLRILIRNNYAYFQVGPSDTGKYQKFFHSALRKDEPKRGFALAAYGAPADKEHWVRFDNFRVTRESHR